MPNKDYHLYRLMQYKNNAYYSFVRENKRIPNAKELRQLHTIAFRAYAKSNRDKRTRTHLKHC